MRPPLIEDERPEPGDLLPLVERLLDLDPGTPEAELQQHAAESLLMVTLRWGGRRPAEEQVESLSALGYPLERMDALPCMWRLVIPPPRVLEIWFTGGEDPAVPALSYRIGSPWGSPAQKRAQRLQAAFYARYEGLSGLAPGGATPSPEDGLIMLVGELEADLNHGGFDQYLDNKGAPRAREALEALTVIGAKRTARWLSSALRPGTTPVELEALTRRFNDKPEDLPSLVMKHMARRKKAE